MAKLLHFQDRRITFVEGQKIVVGRSSSRTKQAPAFDNLFFDNPVISRKHATIHMHAGNLYVTDTSSTHGVVYTMNSSTDKLRSGVPRLLSDKGILHFGTDVVRDTAVHKKVSGTIRIDEMLSNLEKIFQGGHRYGMYLGALSDEDEEQISHAAVLELSKSAVGCADSETALSKDTSCSLIPLQVESVTKTSPTLEEKGQTLRRMLATQRDASSATPIYETSICETPREESGDDSSSDAESSNDDPVVSESIVKEPVEQEMTLPEEDLSDDCVSSCASSVFEDAHHQVMNPDSESSDCKFEDSTMTCAVYPEHSVVPSMSKQLIIDLDEGTTSIVGEDAYSIHWDDSASEDDAPSEYKTQKHVDTSTVDSVEYYPTFSDTYPGDNGGDQSPLSEAESQNNFPANASSTADSGISDSYQIASTLAQEDDQCPGAMASINAALSDTKEQVVVFSELDSETDTDYSFDGHSQDDDEDDEDDMMSDIQDLIELEIYEAADHMQELINELRVLQVPEDMNISDALKCDINAIVRKYVPWANNDLSEPAGVTDGPPPKTSEVKSLFPQEASHLTPLKADRQECPPGSIVDPVNALSTLVAMSTDLATLKERISDDVATSEHLSAQFQDLEASIDEQVDSSTLRVISLLKKSQETTFQQLQEVLEELRAVRESNANQSEAILSNVDNGFDSWGTIVETKLEALEDMNSETMETAFAIDSTLKQLPARIEEVLRKGQRDAIDQVSCLEEGTKSPPSIEQQTVAEMVANAQAQVRDARAGKLSVDTPSKKRSSSDADFGSIESSPRKIRSLDPAEPTWIARIGSTAAGVFLGAGLTFAGLVALGST